MRRQFPSLSEVFSSLGARIAREHSEVLHELSRRHVTALGEVLSNLVRRRGANLNRINHSSNKLILFTILECLGD